MADTAQWTRADGLIVGDRLSTIAGTALLKGVVYTTERVPVYNLSIPGSPTYYVGEHGVWVHNCKPRSPNILKGNKSKKASQEYGYRNEHHLKSDNLDGVEGSGAHWDIFKDKDTGKLWLGNKSQENWIQVYKYE